MKKVIGRRQNLMRRLYLKILFALLSRAIPWASRICDAVRREAAAYPPGLLISFGLWPDGPGLALSADGRGGLYPPPRGERTEADLSIEIKSLEAAFRLFTFRESTAASEAAGRLIARGSLPQVISFIRIMDQVEILLLPKVIARRAVKEWRRPKGLHRQRARLYASLVLPPPRSARRPI